MQFIKSVLRLLIPFYTNLMFKSDKRIFCLFYNIKSVLIGSPSRLSWSNGLFKVEDRLNPSITYYSILPYPTNLFFELGFRNTAKTFADTYFLNEIDFEDDDIFLDCGANIGAVNLYFQINSIKINYFGFEPSIDEFRALKENISSDNLYNIGLWNSDEVLEFYVSSNNGDSSFFETADYDCKKSITVSRLSNFIDSDIKCLKLEAEGAEPEIIKGIGDKIKYIKYISADLGFERGINQESTLIEATNLLEERGFKRIKYSPERLTALFLNTNI